jgi:hypothetical protein
MKDWEAAYIAGIIDGEGTITLTRMHRNENRRPCITIASTDKELLLFVQTLSGGIIADKRNYKTKIHKNSFTLNIKKKESVLMVLQSISKYLRVDKKKQRALWILKYYERVTLRNGKYTSETLKKEIDFERQFFRL